MPFMEIHISITKETYSFINSITMTYLEAVVSNQQQMCPLNHFPKPNTIGYILPKELLSLVQLRLLTHCSKKKIAEKNAIPNRRMVQERPQKW